MVDALDTLQGMSESSFDPRWTRHAPGVLDDLRGVLPADVAAGLLPREDHAVAALRDLQSGFLLPLRLRGGTIRATTCQGDSQAAPADRSTGFVLDFTHWPGVAPRAARPAESGPTRLRARYGPAVHNHCPRR